MWYNLGSNTDPAIPAYTPIEVNVNSGDSANTVAQKAYNAIVAAIPTLTLSISTNIITLISKPPQQLRTMAHHNQPHLGLIFTTQAKDLLLVEHLLP